MGKEIERKYLVTSECYKTMADSAHYLEQAYISTYPQPTVRLRIIDHQYSFLTIKGANHGVERDEWEFAIDINEAEEMMSRLPLTSHISKTRYHVGRWEVDEFHGKLEGLVIAEIELPAVNSPVPSSPFIGKEVSNDHRYFNSSLGSADAPPSEEFSL